MAAKGTAIDASASNTAARRNIVVRCHGVSHTFHGKDHLRDVDIEIPAGKIFGVIGPDGAGKTTLLHILSGIVEPKQGVVKVLGKAPRDARLDIGYVTQKLSLYQDLTVEENLQYSAGVKNVSGETDARSNLALLGLDRFSNRLVRDLSGGMKQKLALLCALISHPRLLLLDEPTSGLDPIARREFWQLIAKVCQEGVTAVVATPRLEEGEFCHQIALIESGRIHESGSPNDLRNRSGLCRLEIETNELDRSRDLLRDSTFRQEVGVESVFVRGNRLEVLVESKNGARDHVEQRLNDAGVQYNLSRSLITLDDVFVLKLRQNQSIDYTPISYPRMKELSQSQGKVAVELQDLSKQFKDFTAVNHLNLQIKYGEIFGLLGANGAGKTTTIKMICGLVNASEGTIKIAGEKQDIRKRDWRTRIGYMSQKFTLYPDLTVMENLQFYGSAYELPRTVLCRKIDWALKTCQLEESKNSIVGSLPVGLQQRLAFAASVLHEPEILILDEPTSGIDPLGRRQLWRLIRGFAREGTAILVTTHFLDEAEYCNSIGLMVDGNLVGLGSPEILKSESGKIFAIRTTQVRELFACLSKRLEPWRLSIFPDGIHIHSTDSIDSDELTVRDALRECGLTAPKIATIDPTLEEAFISLVHRARGQKK